MIMHNIQKKDDVNDVFFSSLQVSLDKACLTGIEGLVDLRKQ